MSPLIFWNLKEMDSLFSSKCLVYGCIKVFSSGQILMFRNCAVAESAYGASLTMNGSKAAISSVLECPPLNWKDGYSIHGH